MRKAATVLLLDMHAHLLPGVDDGARSTEESLKLLKLLAEQGVEAVFVTPHFSFCHRDPDAARERIQSVFDSLKPEAEAAGLPALALGYEVSYYRGISANREIPRYTLGGTDELLLELPMAPITDEMVNDIVEVAYNYRLVPILAHLERYTKCPGFEQLLPLLKEGDVRAQVTASAVLTHGERKIVDRLVKANCFSYVGSDTHSTEHRPPHFTEFFRYADKKYGAGFCEMLTANGEMLWHKSNH